ncbi:hypothetical protein SanaruYs_34280 [Chryseotalea sanaruensis]|uniref:HEAT repeat domain-containing protein n=1 Tax=Chryseotalea sanaruensis TaxID=2482724 RepID=A0A401UE51_9BACT|nr:HEAT repeat domain-containing protein [Chryseotalea sanaruensis]GCC53185.1 hypothetical protein SanaruYs_34280 [Chryseotalea sanaruensis]
MRYITFVFMLSCLSAFAQSSDNYIEKYFVSLHRNENPERVVVEKIKQIDIDILCELITPYLNDSLSIIRLNAYHLLHERGMQSIMQQDRQKVVSNLLRGWFDTDTGINGFVASCLSKYAKNDFTLATKDSLVLLINQSPGYYDKLLRMVGFLDVKTLIPALQQKLEAKLITNERQRWAAYLALSRMGDDNATQFVLDKVKSLGVTDDVVYTLFPDLVYTRQRTTIDYLIEQLYRDEKNCNSTNAERSKPITCAFRIIDYLAAAITDYPFKTDVSGELVVDDYQEALQDVRAWFKTKGDLYEINYEHM